MRKRHFFCCFWLGCWVVFTACNVTKRLPDGQAQLIKNSFELVGHRSIPDHFVVEDEILTLVKQKPQRPFLGFFKNFNAWLYQRKSCEQGEIRCDSAGFLHNFRRFDDLRTLWRHSNSACKFNNWLCSKVAEPPVILDDALTLKTEQNLLNYLRNRGYFRAKVSHETTFRKKGKEARVRYVLEPHEKFKIDSVRIVCRDSAIGWFLKNTASESFLKTGDDLDVKRFDQEKARIVRLLRNEGYAYFLPNFLDFEADTTGLKGNLTLTILPFSDSAAAHPTFQIGRLTVFSDYNLRTGVRLDTTINGIRFLSSEPRFRVKPTVVLRALTLKTGDLLRLENLENTNRRIGNLGVYRFISIRPTADTTRLGVQNVNISLTRNKRFSIGHDEDFNYTNDFNSLSLVSRLIGGSVGGHIRSRNLFGRAVQLNLSGEYALEFALFGGRGARFVNSQEFRPQADLVFPHFFDYLGFWRLANWLSTADKGQSSRVETPLLARLRNDAQPRFSASFDFRQQFRFYKLKTLTASFGYELRGSARQTYSIRHFGIDAFLPKTEADFNVILAKNPFLKKTFGEQFLTGFVLREFGFQWKNDASKAGGRRVGFRLNLDFSGAEAALFSTILSKIQHRDSVFQPKLAGLPFAEYVRAEMQLDATQPFFKKWTLAGRIGAGLIRPFGTSKETPYLKQFAVGGPYSLRGWALHQIGPGGFDDPINSEPRSTRPPYYQTGDFKLEMTAEVRFPLYYVMQGAVFVDAGNIWTVKTDATRPGSDFKNFANEIAVNTGFGVRLDFGFFLIRSDWGLPLRNNFADGTTGKHWIYGQNGSKFGLNQFNWNLAIGFPF